jgi:3-methyl-2-oxobutanoate hydroxymethyltransferase
MTDSGVKPVTVAEVRDRKAAREPVTMLTAYDHPTARILDQAGVDILLVGDSLGMVVLGHDSTIPVTLDDMIHHTRAVTRGVRRALVVGDMPYGSFHTSADDAVRAGIRFLKEGRASAVKVEGGRVRVGIVRALIEAEIPVMGHVGLTPQSVHRFGGYRVQGRRVEEAAAIVEDAIALQRAGVFSLVLEGIPSQLAKLITEKLEVPTIGIGAGPHCDGQVLVTHDMLGVSGFRPGFVRVYAELGEAMREAASRYCDDVRAGAFPSREECHHLDSETMQELEARFSVPSLR